MLAQRAPSEGPRWTRAVREQTSSPSKGVEKMRICGGSPLLRQNAPRADPSPRLLALQGRREDENIRWVPGKDGMELAAAALAAHDIADDKGLLIDRLFTRPVDCFLCHHD